MSTITTFDQFKQRFPLSRDKMLGSGAFGVVFLSYDNERSLAVAVKMSPVKDGMVYTLQREVELAAQLPNHTNIARYEPETFRLDTDGLSVYDFAIMQYYPDGNLAQLVARNRPVGAELQDVVRGILSGIAFLHSPSHNGQQKLVVVHRDLKPSNILVVRHPDGKLVPKIADFGLARTTESGKSLSKTSGGAFTAQYMSPEQANLGSIDWRTDLWSFGSILYFLCTGRHAFDFTAAEAEKSIGEISQKVRKGIFPPLADLAEPYRSMIAACWVIDRNQRIQSATALLEMLSSGARVSSEADGARENSAADDDRVSSAASPNPDTYDVAAAIAEIHRLRDAGQREAALAKCRAGLKAVPNHQTLQQLEKELAPQQSEPEPKQPAIQKSSVADDNRVGSEADGVRVSSEASPNPDTYDVAAAIAEIHRLRDAGQRAEALAKCQAGLRVVPGHQPLQQLEKELAAPPIPEKQPVINPKPGEADVIGFQKPITSNSPNSQPRRKRLLLIGSAAALAVVALLLWQPWNSRIETPLQPFVNTKPGANITHPDTNQGKITPQPLSDQEPKPQEKPKGIKRTIDPCRGARVTLNSTVGEGSCILKTTNEAKGCTTFITVFKGDCPH